MIIDVILVFIVTTLLIIGFFLAKTAPLFRSERERQALPREKGPFFLLEERLHETESPEAISRPAPYPGAHATLAAARDHFALADAYQNDWHRRFPDEPAARPERRQEAIQAAAATGERPRAGGEPPAAEAKAEQEIPVQREAVAKEARAEVMPTGPEAPEETVVIIEETVYEAVILPPLPEEGEEERPERAA